MVPPLSGRKPKDVLPGERIGDLTILAVFCGGRGRTRFCYRCVCGRERVTDGYCVLKSKSPSCGCQRRPRLRHGYAKVGELRPEWRTWAGMLQRCHNPKDKFYSDYGGRGIEVCDRWKESFDNFIFDMGNRPSSKHSIDRIDVNGDYEPTNCRWADAVQQGRNKRNNRRIILGNETRCLSEWSEITGLKAHTIAMRLKLGWGVEKALTTPVRPHNERSG